MSVCEDYKDIDQLIQNDSFSMKKQNIIFISNSAFSFEVIKPNSDSCMLQLYNLSRENIAYI